MKQVRCSTVLFLFTGVILVSTAFADGLQKGEPIGVFKVTKIAGADDDGVSAGDELCYRCRYGSRPLVILFSRSTDDEVLQFSKMLDHAVRANADIDLKGLIVMLGDDVVSLKEAAEKFAKIGAIARTPVVVAKDNVDGPANYHIQDHDVTVILAKDNEVVDSFTFDTAADLDAGKMMNAALRSLR